MLSACSSCQELAVQGPSQPLNETAPLHQLGTESELKP